MILNQIKQLDMDYYTILKNHKKIKDKCNIGQDAFIKSPLKDSKLFGIPGGGKTTTIIKKIIYHYDKNEIQNSTFFLMLTFNKFSQQDFLAKGRNKRKGLFTISNIRTIHSLSGTIVKTLINKNSSSIETVVKSAFDIIKKENSETIKKIYMFKNVKVIFVDEAQDLNKLYYDFLLNLKEKLGCSLILVGDPNQNIYQFNNGSDKYLLNHNGDKYVLTKNYRSTWEIVNFLNYIRPWSNMLPKMTSYANRCKKGKKPVVFIDNILNIQKDIIMEIKNYNGNLSNIAIIGPVKKSKPRNGYYINIGLSLITNLLTKKKIKFIQHYNFESDQIEFGERVYGKVDNHVNILTCHTSKGLEYDKVLLINFHHNTFGRIPTKEEHNIFNYLWYVGMSRAKNELKIYVDNDKKINNNIFRVPKNIYEKNKKIKEQKISFNKEKKRLAYPITKIINNKKIFDESMFYFFEKSFDLNSYKVEQIFDIDQKLDKYLSFSSFSGIFFEHVFMYYCKHNKERFIKLMKSKQKYFDRLIDIPTKFMKCVGEIELYIYNYTTLNEIDSYKNNSRIWKEFFEYLLKKMNNNFETKFAFLIKNNVQNTCFNEIKCEINSLLEYNDENDDNAMVLLAKICLFEYQYDLELKYLYDNKNENKNGINIKQFVKDSHQWINKIKDYTSNITDTYCYQSSNCHPYMNINGKTDILKERNHIIELKFVNNITLKHIIQGIFYFNNINYNWTDKLYFDIINLKTGEKRMYNLKPKISNYEFNLEICKKLKTKFNNPVIFYDLEVNTNSIFDALNGDIIERHCQDYLTGWVISKGLIKPKIKIYPEIKKLTGITDKMIKNMSDKNLKKMKDDINTFVENSINPIFVAHNGNGFDHKIMQKNKIFNNDNIKLLDSKIIMGMNIPGKIHTLKLSEIYKCVINKYPNIIHRAYADVLMMIDIFKKIYFDYNDFLELINRNTNMKMLNNDKMSSIDYELIKSRTTLFHTEKKYKRILFEHHYILSMFLSNKNIFHNRKITSNIIHSGNSISFV